MFMILYSRMHFDFMKNCSYNLNNVKKLMNIVHRYYENFITHVHFSQECNRMLIHIYMHIHTNMNECAEVWVGE